MNKSPHGRPQVLAVHEIRTLLKRGFDALNAGRTDEAGACCKQILSLAPRTVEAHFLVGLIATEDKLPKVAIQAFGSVTTLDPNHAAGWAHLARVFSRISQPERAPHAALMARPGDTTRTLANASRPSRSHSSLVCEQPSAQMNP